MVVDLLSHEVYPYQKKNWEKRETKRKRLEIPNETKMTEKPSVVVDLHRCDVTMSGKWPMQDERLVIILVLGR